MIGLLLALALAADDGISDDAVDQRVRLRLRPGAVEVELTVQLGRQAAFAEVLQIDTDRDGRLSPEEQARYFATLEETVRRGLEFQADGRDIALKRVGEMRLEMPFRKIYRFEAAIPTAARVEFHNENFTSSPGAASIVVDPPAGLDLVVEGDPDQLQRDVRGDLRPGSGTVGRRADREVLPAPSGASTGLGIVLRLAALTGLVVATLFGARMRLAIAGTALATAGACGLAAVATSAPPAAQAERIFLALHEESARSADPSLRRIKPIETQILPSFGLWGTEFRVRHRWAAYGSVAHSGHAHAEVRESEERFRVRWSAGAWTLDAGT